MLAAPPWCCQEVLKGPKFTGVFSSLQALLRFHKITIGTTETRSQRRFLHKHQVESPLEIIWTRGNNCANVVGEEDKEEGCGVPENLAEAAAYYKMACDTGYVDAYTEYGSCLDFGKGVDQDLIEAARLYKIAADHGVSEAQYRYGLLLARGDGVPQNLEDAARYFKMAADQGHTDAQTNYQTCLEHGHDVHKS